MAFSRRFLDSLAFKLSYLTFSDHSTLFSEATDYVSFKHALLRMIGRKANPEEKIRAAVPSTLYSMDILGSIVTTLGLFSGTNALCCK